jgi:hypothetical protein
VTTLAYAGCFLALAALAGLAAASGGHWLARLPLLAATPLLALGVWWQLSERDGWPAGSRPAEGSASSPGWSARHRRATRTRSSSGRSRPGRRRRARTGFRDRPGLERQVARAAHDAQKGARVAVSFRPAQHRHGKSTGARSRLHFYRLPPPAVQVKGHRRAGAG